MPGGILPSGKCCGCNKKPHGPNKDGKPTNNREARQKHCPAWGQKCNTCGKEGHFTAVCKAEPKKSEANGTQKSQKEEKKKQEDTDNPSGGGASFEKQVMPDAWDRGTGMWACGVHIKGAGIENSEPLIWANEQDISTPLEEEPQAGNA
jgi:hypothetical protein